MKLVRSFHVFVKDFGSKLNKSRLLQLEIKINSFRTCATQVPSCPAFTSRSLSLVTLSIAFLLASSSFLIGICAAIPKQKMRRNITTQQYPPWHGLLFYDRS